MIHAMSTFFTVLLANFSPPSPDFLVKAIVDQAELPAPHFPEYIDEYSLPIPPPLPALYGLIDLRAD